MQAKAGPAGPLDARTVDKADLISARRLLRRRLAARQQIFAQRNEPVAAATKPFEQGDVGNIEEPGRRGFRGQRAQGSTAGRIGQHQSKQIGGAFDVARAMKRAMPTRQRIHRFGAAQSKQEAGEVGLCRIRQGKQLHSKLESEITRRGKIVREA